MNLYSTLNERSEIKSNEIPGSLVERDSQNAVFNESISSIRYRKD